MWDFIVQIFPYALAATAPILVTALGGLFSEKSGVVNIGLEGLMLMGTFASAFFISNNYNSMGNTAIWIGIIVGALAGGVFSLLHAFACVTLSANQTVSGVAINLISTAITVFLARQLTQSGRITIVKGIGRGDVGFLAKIPIIGPLFFSQAYITTFIVLGLVVLVWYIMTKTIFGLRIKACGEYPQAAGSLGINVYVIRYIAIALSGLLAGLGGSILVVTYAGEFSGTVSGLGFLALASLVFGQWNAVKVLGATLFFGFMKTLGTMAVINEFLKTLAIPVEFYNILPYAVTIIALVLVSKNAAGPRALGKPYNKGQR